MAETKLQVMSHRGPARAGPSSSRERDGASADVGNRMIYGVLHRRLWFEAMAAAVGHRADARRARAAAAAPAITTGSTRAVLAQLREVIVPRITDPLALVRAKGVARIVKYLDQVNTLRCLLRRVRARRSHRAARRPAGVDHRRRASAAAAAARAGADRRGSTSATSGAASRARPSSHGPRWARSPTATGPSSR